MGGEGGWVERPPPHSHRVHTRDGRTLPQWRGVGDQRQHLLRPRHRRRNSLRAQGHRSGRHPHRRRSRRSLRHHNSTG